MRVQILLSVRGSLPVSYMYWLGSSIFRAIAASDEDLAAELHSAKPFKPYHFSRLLGRAVVSNGVIRFISSQVSFYFASLDKRVVVAFLDGLLGPMGGNMRLGRFRAHVVDVENVDYPRTRFAFTTLSPVYISAKLGGRKVALRPDDPIFHQELIANLHRKFAHFLGKPYKGTVHLRYTSFRPRMRYVKGTPVPAYDMDGELSADAEMIRLIWDVGLGEKNAMGFGMVGLRR